MRYTERLLQKYHISGRLLTSVAVIILVGFIFGFMASGDLKDITYEVDRVTSSRVKLFLNAFSVNFWYLFVSWMAGMVTFGLILNYFIAFFKGFIWGVTFTLLIRSEAVYGVYSFFKLILLQLIFLLPALIYITYQGVKTSLYGLNVQISGRLHPNSFSEYFKVIFKAMIIVIIYSIINSLFTNVMR